MFGSRDVGLLDRLRARRRLGPAIVVTSAAIVTTAWLTARVLSITAFWP